MKKVKLTEENIESFMAKYKIQRDAQGRFTTTKMSWPGISTLYAMEFGEQLYGDLDGITITLITRVR